MKIPHQRLQSSLMKDLVSIDIVTVIVEGMVCTTELPHSSIIYCVLSQPINIYIEEIFAAYNQ